MSWPSLPKSFSYSHKETAPPLIIISDTQDLYCGWSEPSVKQINLGKACRNLGLNDIDTDKLHNAGNDAFATLRVWELLMDMPDNARQQTQDASLAIMAGGDATQLVKAREQSHQEVTKAEQSAQQAPDSVDDLIQF